MRQRKRRESLCYVSAPRREVTTCIKDVVRRSRYVNAKCGTSSDCQWAFKVGGIVTHPQVSDDVCMAFSARRDARVGNK